ncbi:MAG TPA: 2-isopropylmalate synthase [bacterium]|nr:2-isopropylmalate synthase [bacterium]HOL47955.1 2-isopropylmalate synthase [bacterium]HPQ19298.1 2-isopropylmalate synthase [bacterium]
MKTNKINIKIFDTTLRDGEQSPGASMNIDEKLMFAKQLAKLKVDAIEAGFPISSQGDFEAVKLIAQTIKGPEIVGLARAVELDIKRCYEAVKYSAKPRIHTFIATSDIHIKYKLKSTKEKVLETAVNAVKLAKKLCDNVEFSAEDAARSDINFLVAIVEKVIEAGATTINIPDTVGYSIPFEFGKLIKTLIERVKNSDKVIFSVHCHNDLGLATANSLTAVANGARQVECTINGIGERAGNAALEEVVMALNTRKDLFPNFYTNIITKEIYKTSKLLQNITGINVQPNKAIVGKNAFAHEAGIHQDGVIKERLTYEIMSPKDIGIEKSELVLGKHSGRHAFKLKLKELGYEIDGEKFEKAFVEFKNLCDKKKQVFDDDIIAIVESDVLKLKEIFIIDKFQVSSGNNILPTASVQLIKDNEKYQAAATGDGPVDALFNAIDKITKFKVNIIDYNLKAKTKGRDAIGEVIIIAEVDNTKFVARGASTDIIEASAKAYLNIINRYLHSLITKKNKGKK